MKIKHEKSELKFSRRGRGHNMSIYIHLFHSIFGSLGSLNYKHSNKSKSFIFKIAVTTLTAFSMEEDGDKDCDKCMIVMTGLEDQLLNSSDIFVDMVMNF